MKRLLILVMVLSALLIGIPPVAVAATHNVSPGDDIQAAIDNASPGDTIVFALGTYSLSSTLNVNKSLTLTSEDPYATPKPLLDGGGTLGTIIEIAADDVTLDGLEIANGTGDLVYQGNPYSDTTVRNSVIHDSTGDECVQLKYCSNCLIECCLAYNCAGDGLNIADGSNNSAIQNNEVHHSDSPDGAIYVYYSAAMTVECNYLHDNTASNGIKVYKMGNWGTSYVRHNLVVNNTFNGKKYDQDGNAIQLYVPFDEVNVDAELYVQHNTVDSNTGNASYTITAGHGIYWGQKYVDGAPVYMLDNIISNNGGWGIKTELLANVNPSGVNDYNDTWNNNLGTISNAFPGVTVGPNNISADPLYNPDYTLGASSPCIGAASDGKDMGRLFDECGCAPPNEPPDCSGAYPSVETIWSPNHKFVAVDVLGVTDPDGDPVTITIDSIYQDEPVDSTGDGSFVPDGQGVGDAMAYVRAERDGSGNGRVYHIGFTADDGKGGTCSDTVMVGVPKSQGKKGAPVDDGKLYDSTVP
jgi:hypothetical protein